LFSGAQRRGTSQSDNNSPPFSSAQADSHDGAGVRHPHSPPSEALRAGERLNSPAVRGFIAQRPVE